MSASPQLLDIQTAHRARLGFIGVGWIGTHRLKAVAESGCAEIVCIADPSESATARALHEIAPWAPNARLQSLEGLLADDIDGVVIATPNSQHASQSRAALEQGRAVFCQKPLARTSSEAAHVIELARTHDRLLAVDFCYRRIAGMAELKALLHDGTLGDVYAADLVFHNAYGPDKPWFYDASLAGGGCVMDLGIHLVDLLLWALDSPRVERVDSHLYASGHRLRRPTEVVEDYALAEILLASGLTARLACSWRLSAGCDAVIEFTFYGTRGAARVRNVNGSFYDFKAEHCEGTRTRPLATASSEWGGVAICDWACQLRSDPGFDTAIEQVAEVHRVLDAIYGR
jgi:predicted dehydrogenase